MKSLRTVLLGVALLGVAALAGCAADETASPAAMPRYNGGEPAQMVELAAADFADNPHISREIQLVRPASLIVSLETGSAPDLAWAAPVEISSPVVTEFSHALTTPVAAPDPSAPAAPVKDVWVFDSVAPGEGLVRFVYGGTGPDETARWTLTLYITVK